MTQHAILTPATRRALVALRKLPPQDLRRRPGRALARSQGVSEALGQRRVKALVDHGLLRRSPTGRGIQFLVPADPSAKLHSHPPGHPCKTKNKTIRRMVSLKRGGRLRSRVRSIQKPCLLFSAFSERESSKEYNMPSDLISKLKKLGDSYTEDRRGLDQPTKQDRFLAKIYIEHLRQLIPDYVMGRTMMAAVIQARKMLQEAKIRPRYWRQYIDWIARRMSRITRGRVNHVSSGNLTSKKHLENFLFQVPQSLDQEDIAKLLKGAGIKHRHLFPALAAHFLVIYKAERKISEGGLYRKTTKFLFEHADEIGLVFDFEAAEQAEEEEQRGWDERS